MTTKLSEPRSFSKHTKPLCPVFGTCGGCEFQDRPYEEEIQFKEAKLRDLFSGLFLPDEVFLPTEISPESYYYRHRLDLTMKRSRGDILMGFQLMGSKRLIEIQECPISMKEISDFLPELKKQAAQKLPEKYRTANLVIKTGEDGRIFWGGIGRRSLEMKPEDYFWTTINGKRIYYSLGTFFQANLSILPKLMKRIEALAGFSRETIFFDLYGGVGLFGVYFADQVSRVMMVEETPASVKVAKYNLEYHGLKDFEIYEGKVEECFPPLMKVYDFQRRVAIVDPPRRGLSEGALRTLSNAKDLTKLLYLSCGPEALVRDLKVFVQKGWLVKQVIPFDFFPKTVHLETLVCLEPQ